MSEKSADYYTRLLSVVDATHSERPGVEEAKRHAAAQG